MNTWIGHVPRVMVQTREQQDLQAKARDLLIGQTIEDVRIVGDSVVLELGDGSEFTMAYQGGLKEAS